VRLATRFTDMAVAVVPLPLPLVLLLVLLVVAVVVAVACWRAGCATSTRYMCQQC
jgi:hypothetical protein